MWLSLRGDKAKKSGVPLAEEQVWRFGRVTLVVKHINVNGGPHPNLCSDCVEMPDAAELQPCKICLGEDSSSQNPLLSPCKCTGSMQYVHFACLTEWLQQKISIRHSSKVSSYFWRDVTCELCKTPFPSSVQYRKRSYNITSVTYPTKAYVVMEEFRSNQVQPYGLHILSLAHGESLTVGRANETELKIADVSVSRKHATIRNKANQFYVVDASSKFGTLLQTNKWISVTSAADVVLQSSRTLLVVTVKRPHWFTGCCDKNSIVRKSEDTLSVCRPISATIPSHTTVIPDQCDDMGN